MKMILMMIRTEEVALQGSSSVVSHLVEVLLVSGGFVEEKRMKKRKKVYVEPVARVETLKERPY